MLAPIGRSCWKAGGDGEEEELNRDLHGNDVIIQTAMDDDDKTVAWCIDVEPIGMMIWLLVAIRQSCFRLQQCSFYDGSSSDGGTSTLALLKNKR